MEGVNPFGDFFDVPGVAVGVSEAHRYIDDELFVVLDAEGLDGFDALHGLGDGGVGVANLECFADGEGVSEVVDGLVCNGFFGTALVGYDGE